MALGQIVSIDNANNPQKTKSGQISRTGGSNIAFFEEDLIGVEFTPAIRGRKVSFSEVHDEQGLRACRVRLV